jgi:hypothetical protein
MNQGRYCSKPFECQQCTASTFSETAFSSFFGKKFLETFAIVFPFQKMTHDQMNPIFFQQAKNIW